MKIAEIKAREILDSRGNPTVEAEIFLDSNSKVIASVSSGKSTGSHEAAELRDGGDRLSGNGVLKSISNIIKIIGPAVKGKDASKQKEIDELMITLDGTQNKTKLGANAILPISLCVLKAGALSENMPLFQYVAKVIDNNNRLSMPIPMMNLINGGEHADNNLDIQEFMVVPAGQMTFRKRIETAVDHYHNLGKILQNNGYNLAVGDEGGYAPQIPSDKDALDLLHSAGPSSIALDFADAKPHSLTYRQLINNYPVISFEDSLGEDDWTGWQKLNADIGDRIMLVGDDLFTTNIERLKRGVKEKTANAILIKPNQIGTISETFEVIKYAQLNNYRVVVSHRSGETEDTVISDIAVGAGAQFVKFGAPCRGERTAKYNRLLRIEEEIYKTQN